MHKTEGLANIIFETYKNMWCHMVFISIKHHMAWPFTQCVPIHHPNMHWHTGNVCCVLLIAHVSIFQANIQISIIQTHALQYVFMFITSLHGVQFTEDANYTKIKCIACVFVILLLCHIQNIHKKRTCFDGYIYFWI